MVDNFYSFQFFFDTLQSFPVLAPIVKKTGSYLSFSVMVASPATTITIITTR